MKNDTQDNSLYHGHDKLFKIAFQNQQTVIEYLTHFFPKNLLALLDLDKLTLDTNNYISQEFEEYYSDIVYRTTLKDKDAALVLLFEHKSKNIDRTLFIQLLAYMLGIWRIDLKEDRPFTIILPIVVLQRGKRFHPKAFHEYFWELPKELRPFIPHFDYILTNVQKIEDSYIFDLNDKSLLRTLFLAFKYIKNNEFLYENFPEFFRFYDDTPQYQEFFHQILLYLYRQSELSKDEVRQLLKLLPQQLNSTSMTLYAQIKEEGKLEGKIEGRIEGKLEGKIEGKRETQREIVLKGWRKGISVEILADMTDLSIEAIKAIISDYKNA